MGQIAYDYFISLSVLGAAAISLLLSILAKGAPAMKSIGETKKARWLENFIKKYGRAICITFAVIVFVAGNFYQFYRVSVERNAFKVALEETKDQLAEAKAELTAKRNRETIKLQLRKFYAEAETLERGGQASTPEELPKYAERVESWKDTVSDWLTQNMSEGAASLFRDIAPYQTGGGYIRYTDSINQEEEWLRNKVSRWRQNLKKLIQSDDWENPDG